VGPEAGIVSVGGKSTLGEETPIAEVNDQGDDQIQPSAEPRSLDSARLSISQVGFEF